MTSSHAASDASDPTGTAEVLCPLPGVEAVPDLLAGLVRHSRHAPGVAARHALEGPWLPHQVHGATIRLVEAGGGDVAPCDGLIVAQPGVLVGVKGADCPGVLLVDPERRVLAVVHSGWRGTAARIVVAAIERMVEEHGCAPARLVAAIGPSIRRDRYEVDQPVVAALCDTIGAEATPALVRPTRPGHAFVDVAGFVKAQLREAGVPPAQIHDEGLCTQGAPGWHSHRRDGAAAGRHLLLAAFTH